MTKSIGRSQSDMQRLLDGMKTELLNVNEFKASNFDTQAFEKVRKENSNLATFQPNVR